MKHISKDLIGEHRKCAFKYISDMHETYGHFPLFDYYPKYKEKKGLGWHYMYKSPFIHASALDSLLNAGYDKSFPLIGKATEVLLDFREPGDLWRYWNVNEAEHPTFSDTDETAIASFALRKLNYVFDNKDILYSKINNEGEIYTWIVPDFKIFTINPFVYLWLKRANRKVLPILNDFNWITKYDTEPSITANVLAYLGDNKKTEKSIDYVIRAWLNDCERNYQHYDRKIIFAFHIARAYKEGISGFYILKEHILNFIKNELLNFSFPEILMAYLSVTYFYGNHPVADNIRLIIEKKIIETEAYKEPYPYTTEKKRVYYGGSGVLTASWFLEVTKDW